MRLMRSLPGKMLRLDKLKELGAGRTDGADAAGGADELK